MSSQVNIYEMDIVWILCNVLCVEIHQNLTEDHMFL